MAEGPPRFGPREVKLFVQDVRPQRLATVTIFYLGKKGHIEENKKKNTYKIHKFITFITKT